MRRARGETWRHSCTLADYVGQLFWAAMGSERCGADGDSDLACGREPQKRESQSYDEDPCAKNPEKGAAYRSSEQA